VALHGAEGNIEALGDFLAGAAVELAEEPHFTATLGERAQRLREGFEALAALHGFNHRGRRIEQGETATLDEATATYLETVDWETWQSVSQTLLSGPR
jgi:hypothetical protein